MEWNIEDDEKYDVEKILHSSRVNGKNQYLVK